MNEKLKEQNELNMQKEIEKKNKLMKESKNK